MKIIYKFIQSFEQTILIIGISFVILLAEAEIDIVVPSFPGLMSHYGISIFYTELTLIINLIAHSFSGLVLGSVADSCGKKKVLLLGIIAFILGSILTVIANNFYIMLIGRAVQGAAMAAPMVLGYLVVIEGVRKPVQENRVSILNGIASISLAFTPVVGSVIAVKFGWKVNFHLLLWMGFIALIIVVYLVPSDRLINNRLAELNSKNTSYLGLIRNKKVSDLIVGTLFLPAGWFTFIALAPIIYIKNFGLTLEEYAWYQGFIALIYGMISLFMGKIIDYLGQRLVFLLSILLLLIAILGIIVGFYLNLFSPLYVMLTILIGSLGSIFLVNRTQLLAINELLESKGKINAMITFGRWVVAAIAIQTSGFLFTFDKNITFLIIAFLWLGGVVNLWYLEKRYKLILLNNL